LYYILLNITAVLKKYLNNFSELKKVQDREAILDSNDNTLSNVLLNNKAACVEFSLIAQKYLQDKG